MLCADRTVRLFDVGSAKQAVAEGKTIRQVTLPEEKKNQTATV